MAVGGQFNKKEYSDLDKLSEQFGGREFLIFDLEGNLVVSRISQTAFAEEIGVCVQTVNNVLNEVKGKHSVKDYILIFKDDFTDEKLKNKIQQIKDRYKPFAVFDVDWNFIGIWDNQVHCAKELKSGRGTIINQLNNINIANKGRKFRYYYLENIPTKYKYKIKEVV